MIFLRNILVLSIYMLIGCEKKDEVNIEQEIFNLIESKCAASSKCSIDLNDLPISKWDEAYIFSNVSKGYIQEKIKLPYTLYKDIGIKIIFIHEGKIMHYTELFPALDTKATKSKITFFFNDDVRKSLQMVDYYILTPDNAKMDVIEQVYSNDGVANIVSYGIHPENLSQIGR
ncbi:hypothetical protein D3C73_192960 [compost metagenome]